MEIRFLLIISLAVAASLGASPVKRYPLDDRRVYALRLSPEAPTTILFPGPLTALDGAGVSVRPEDNPNILISHQSGTAFFSVRALDPNATGAINAVYRDHVYAITLTTGSPPDRTVTFVEASSDNPRQQDIPFSPDRLLSLLDRAKHYRSLAEHYPALVQSIERVTPRTVTSHGGLTITIEEVLRFDHEDTLVLRARLENHGTHPIHFSPSQLAVQVAETLLPVALTDAPGIIPARQAIVISALIVGQVGTPSDHLSAHNSFTLHLPRE